jgi:hypothetical protein
MSKTLTKAIESPEAQTLLSAGLKLVSTDTQLQNGTIVLAGKIRKQAVNYRITETGNVFSNNFKARTVTAASPLKQYKAGLKAAAELLAKRLG